MELVVLVCWMILLGVHSQCFLSVLICLEMLVLVVFVMSVVTLGNAFNIFGAPLLLVFLVLAVCEAVLGLSLLVSSSRVATFYSSHTYSLLKY